MEELNVNFKELEHMDLDKAKEIVSHFDNEDDFEEKYPEFKKYIDMKWK